MFFQEAIDGFRKHFEFNVEGEPLVAVLRYVEETTSFRGGPPSQAERREVTLSWFVVKHRGLKIGYVLVREEEGERRSKIRTLYRLSENHNWSELHGSAVSTYEGVKRGVRAVWKNI